MASLTTKVIDSLHGRPADGMHVEVFWLGPNDAVHPIREMVIDMEGQTIRPLMAGEELERGEYELRFRAGDYFRENGVVEVEPRFLNVVSIRVSIADPDEDYHVPLIISPWAYTVHRG
ncbi:MAG: hydroxyisourate hydrolase [Pseudomonadota bacterium]|jgi:5-hydroxyisourate hydrolase